MPLWYLDLPLASQRDGIARNADLEVVLGETWDVGAQDEVATVVLEAQRGARRRDRLLEVPEQAIELAPELNVRRLGSTKICETETGPIAVVAKSSEHGVPP